MGVRLKHAVGVLRVGGQSASRVSAGSSALSRSAEAVGVLIGTPVRPSCVWDCSVGEKMDC